jgi:hypothetical protein
MSLDAPEPQREGAENRQRNDEPALASVFAAEIGTMGMAGMTSILRLFE